MTYELAKKLKEAGFPSSELWFDTGTKFILEDLVVPTLEELIEACGEAFGSLNREKDKNGKYEYEAWNYTKNGLDMFCKFGETPIEAVANLWLALQKK